MYTYLYLLVCSLSNDGIFLTPVLSSYLRRTWHRTIQTCRADEKPQLHGSITRDDLDASRDHQGRGTKLTQPRTLALRKNLYKIEDLVG